MMKINNISFIPFGILLFITQSFNTSTHSGDEENDSYENNHEYIIIDFFLNKGLTLEQSSGIAGNLWIESKFNPEAKGDNGNSLGLAQWHKSRKIKLLTYLDTTDIDDIFISQLEFMWWELNNSENRAFNKLLEANSVEEATIIFAKYYERPYSQNYNNRVKKSLEIIENFKSNVEQP